MHNIKDIKDYAKNHNVPIIEDNGLKIINNIISKYNVKSLLEIGSAIGYSAICFVKSNDINVMTIERDINMYEQAIININDMNLNDKITIINDDALIFDNSNLGKFDCLYIDAAKSQYKKFMDKYLSNLNENAIIIFDNLEFHGFTKMDPKDIKNRNTRQLVGKINKFKEYLNTQNDYEYKYYEQGDGIGILRKKENE